MMGVGLAVALFVLAIDQGTKWWVLNVLDLPNLHTVAVLPVLNLTMVWNQGVTFGLLTQEGPQGAWILAAVALAVVVFLTVWMARTERAVLAIALGAIAGGAIGNVLDRIRYGAVVDFIHAHAFGYSWYVFNIADAAIVCGVFVLIVDGLLPSRPRLQGPALRQ